MYYITVENAELVTCGARPASYVTHSDKVLLFCEDVFWDDFETQFSFCQFCRDKI